MPHPQLNRTRVKMRPLAERDNKVQIEQTAIDPATPPSALSAEQQDGIAALAERLRIARDNNRPRVCAFGAHSIKNGLGTVFAHLIEQGWLTHLATNGAGIIHDWEFSFQGKSSEDVKRYAAEGQFGNWEETGFTINLALNVGAYEGLGYGEAVGAMIQNEGVTIPSEDDLIGMIRDSAATQPEQSAQAADLLGIIRRFNLPAGWRSIPHPWKGFSAQANAYRLGIPFTGHPMFGHDIIYNHPMNHGASLGRCAERDFLAFAHNISLIDGGVYLSIGSAVMSPMVFEKSYSMAQNLALQAGTSIDGHNIFVADLAASPWDWSQGEPPENNPAYYLRYNKTFSRMGGTMRYIQCDNRDLLLGLCQALR